jgi:hypothetical protein
MTKDACVALGPARAEREHWMTHSELKPPMPIGCVRPIKTEKRPREYGAAAKAKDVSSVTSSRQLRIFLS